MSADDGTADGANEGTATDLDDGRYVYCVVSVDGDAPEGASNVELDLDVAGVDRGTPHVVRAGAIGAVVQPCTSAFESTDVDQLGRWLLQHQAVIDAVGERFGTPLPFRFDTIVSGGDDAVRRWLESERASFESALATLDGCWEYRVEVTFDRASLADAVADDPSLEELAARCESAGEGTAYLLERKYDQRESELVADRLAGHRADLIDRLDDLCEAVRTVERQAGLESLAGGEQSEAEATAGSTAEETASDGEQTAGDGEQTAGDGDETTEEGETESVSLSVLAAGERETAVGEVLEAVADETGASVRFTGPWPPYTYAPELLDGDGTVQE